jgi:hypothetical protein
MATSHRPSLITLGWQNWALVFAIIALLALAVLLFVGD